jgi:hypothetical protein
MEATVHLPRTTVALELINQLIQQRSVYAIFDPVGAPRVPEKMHALSSERSLSLFQGTPYESYTAVAPYLASVDEELFEWIRKGLWAEPWGILLLSRSSLGELFNVFRRFITVRLPDGNACFFRFHDPRILSTFLDAEESARYEFWNGISAYGWSADDAVTLVKRPDGMAASAGEVPVSEVALSPELMNSLGKAQLKSFLDRCSKYLEGNGVTLPANRGMFFQSVFLYARSVGIVLELDLLRFLHLILGWKGMQSIAVVREILSYPEVSGTDKVDLLCELAAFAGMGPEPLRIAGLDMEANAKALQRFLDEHVNDRLFFEKHHSGALTMSIEDTRWRKEWVNYYCEFVSERAKVTRVPVGTAGI